MPLAADENVFHTPSIADFFPHPVLLEGTFLEFNRMQLVRIVAAIVLVTIMVIAARRAKLVPRRGQNVAELLLDFVRVNVAEDIIGKEKAHKYVALLTTIFFAILAFNLTGIIPGLNIAGTSLIGLPVMLALWVYVMYLGAGIRAHGLGGFLKSSLFPPGVPPFLYVLLTPVEFLTVFILRPVTLAVRLMANMVAGHLMLVLCFAATDFFVRSMSGMTVFAVPSLLGGFAITLFEVFVAALQAYIFVVLAAVYISLSISEEH
ncbi:ATP synthase F0, A subunit [Cellulomonas flavigena DSM 20109]|uniref:ATP synthase subunit a n=1 Tax=Cellulomonas flavigena (strain ATCC 482 / DSM 20109 / BCRC 11376 / JCM 18109 / NBRC 3775 / NCIMB 8073 / NRS 134) TaxID=446466 RepID=D5ULC9_CELFN|nr:F0F1 ATP synthase subunit A [Cellulomonas flavigena]ADG73971.1 ATP synthase F0, A subunit [Cellulomonas flavigena DSM 20109]